MSTALAIGLFLISLATSIGFSLVLVRSLDRVGVRFGATDGVIGILTAIGADAPEISAAAAALLSRHQDLGVGVVLGSNIFNLAGLLGLSALISGHVRIGRRGVLLEGSAAIAIALAAVLLVVGSWPAIICLLLVLIVLVPYVGLSAVHAPGSLVESRLPGARFLARALVEEQDDARLDHRPRAADRGDAVLLPVGLAGVVLASIGMVLAAQSLGRHWDMSEVVMGALVLATLTSIPNVLGAVRLALHHRGSAVVSESLNSNSANVLIGLCLPATLLGIGSPGGIAQLGAWWFLTMTILTTALLSFRGGLTRLDGVIVIASYLAFVAVTVSR
ncbi:MAG: sodium:calcium antiporter [Gaiellales bacterium]